MQRVILPAACALLLVITAFWIRADEQISGPADADAHLVFAQIASREIELNGPAGILDVIDTAGLTWPPLVDVLHGICGALFGDSSTAIRAFNLIWVPLIAVVVFAIAGRVTGSARLGTLASVLVLFSPGLAGEIRFASLDILCSLLVGISCLLFLDRALFGSLSRSILTGVVFGLAVFGRVQSILYLAGPFLVAFLSALLRGNRAQSRAKCVTCALLMTLVALLISGCWWAPRFTKIMGAILDRMHPGMIHPGRADVSGFFPGLMYFVKTLGQMAGWSLLFSLLLGVVVLLLRPSFEACLLAVSIAGGLIGLSASIVRHPHYLVAILPQTIVLALWGLERLCKRYHDLWGPILLMTTALPTLVFARPNGASGLDDLADAGVKAGLVTEEYVRRPLRQPAWNELAGAVRQALQSSLSAVDRKEEQSPRLPRFSRFYLIAGVSQGHFGLLWDLLARLIPQFPGMTISENSERRANLARHARARKDQEMFLLTLGPYPGLPVLSTWRMPSSPGGDRLFLYKIPRDHNIRLRGVAKDAGIW
jgi:hypothetical protein